MILKSELTDSFLILKLQKEIGKEKTSIIFKNRSTKEEHSVSPSFDKSGKEVSIDLSKINFDITTTTRYDIHFLIDEKKYRANVQSIYQKKKIDRFFVNIYKYNNSSVVVPYITTNNNLSLLCGNAADIFKTYCHYVYVPRDLPIVSNVKKNAVQLDLTPFNANSEAVFITYYNKEFEKYIALNYVNTSSSSTNITINQSSNPYFNLNDNLFLLSKKRNVIEHAMLGMAKDAIIGGNEENPSNTEEQKPKIRSNITVDKVEEHNNRINFKINPNDLLWYNYDSFRVFLKDNNNVHFMRKADVKMEAANSLALDMTEFYETYGFKRGRWAFYFLVETANYREEIRIGAFNLPSLLKHQRYYESVDVNTYHLITPYLTANNALSLVIKPKVALHAEMLRANTEIDSFIRKKRSRYTGEVSLELEDTKDYTVESLILKYRNKMDDRQHSFPVWEEKQENNVSWVTFDIKPNKLKLEQFYLDLFLEVHIQQKVFLVKVQNPSDELRESIFLNEHKYTIKCNNGYVLHPYITNNNSLTLFYKDKSLYENFWLRLKSKVTYELYQRLKQKFERKEIWLVYEKFSQTAQDNSYFFFKYMYENYPNENVYYVIDKKSPEYQNVKNMKDRVISYLSFKHLLYLYASKLLIGSDAKNHSYLFRQKNGRAVEALWSKKFVYLKHGVTALKNVGYIMKKSGMNAADLFVATSDQETELIHQKFEYEYEDIIPVGLCRWDALVDISKDTSPQEITLMPTWRNWLEDVSDETFLQSDYYRQYMELLRSDELKQLLYDNNIVLNFNIHPKFLPYINNFQVENQNLNIFQFGQVKINELLMRSSLLITDYSSVAWDFYYLKKPVLFFQFDYETYETLQGSYINMEQDLFGDRTTNIPELIEMISQYIETDFDLKNEFKHMWNNSFKYVDNQNSKRTYESIKANANKLGLTKDNERANE